MPNGHELPSLRRVLIKICAEARVSGGLVAPRLPEASEFVQGRGVDVPRGLECDPTLGRGSSTLVPLEPPRVWSRAIRAARCEL